MRSHISHTVLCRQIAPFVFLLAIACGCETKGPPTPEDHAALEEATGDYQRCVHAQVSNLAARPQASYALAKAMRSLCRTEREHIDATLAVYPEDEVETFTAELDAWTIKQVRHGSRRY